MNTGVYQFKLKRGRKIRTRPLITIPEFKKEIPIGLVHGLQPDSKQEFYASLALDRLEIQYNFQYQIFDGRQQKGGQVIDFLCFTKPLVTPLYIQSEYWHKDKSVRMYDLMRCRAYFGASANPPLEAWDYNLEDPDMAYETIKRLFRL